MHRWDGARGTKERLTNRWKPQAFDDRFECVGHVRRGVGVDDEHAHWRRGFGGGHFCDDDVLAVRSLAVGWSTETIEHLPYG